MPNYQVLTLVASLYLFFLLILRQPRSKRPYTLFPYPTLFLWLQALRCFALYFFVRGRGLARSRPWPRGCFLPGRGGLALLAPCLPPAGPVPASRQGRRR